MGWLKGLTGNDQEYCINLSNGLINNIMARKETKADKKIHKVMHEFKHGELKSSSGKKVRSREQAIAIAMSEAKRRK